MNPDILIVGATGTVGSAIVHELEAQKKPFYVGVRNAEKLAHLPQRMIDYAQPEGFGAALEGIKGLFLVAPSFSHGKIETAFQQLIQTAKERGVEHIVYLSALGAEQNEEGAHRKIELMVEATGIAYTFLRPNFFMQNFTTLERTNLEKGIIYLPTGDGKTSYIDVRDIAKVFAAAILNPKHYNQAYPLTGGEAVSSQEIANILSSALDREIRYINPSEEEYAETLRQQGLDEAGVQMNVFLYGFIRNGYVSVILPTIEQVIGQPPTSFEDFAKSIAL